MAKYTPGLFVAIAAGLLGGSHLRAQNIVPEAVCVEYYTNPVVGAIGIFGHSSSGDTPSYGSTGSKGYIAHMAYLSTESADVTITYGVLQGNFLSPFFQVSAHQPQLFHPGHSPTYSMPMEYAQKTWFLAGNKATVTPIGYLDSVTNTLVPPTPTCAPSFVPSTSLSFSQPGTFLHQYLGQVDSGPAAGADQFAVTALSGSSNVSLSNLTYVPNDTANHGSLNPNSIYGDINVGYGSDGPRSVRLQLSVNGTAVMKGLTSIGYTGTQAPANIQITQGTPQSTSAGTPFATTLQVKITDSGNNPVSGVTVIFSAPGSGASATVTAPALTDTNGLTTVTAAANLFAGAYSVTASVVGVANSATFNLTNTAATTITVNPVVGLAGTAGVPTVPLSATLSSSAGPVSSGTITFTVTNSANSQVGTAVTGTVAKGGASATFSVPQGTPAGAYTVTAAYSGAPVPGPLVFLPSSGSGQLSLLAPGTPIRVTQLAVSRDSEGFFVVNLTLSNPTNSAVAGVALTKAQMGSTQSNTRPLPVPGTVPANSSVGVQVSFASTVGTSGTPVVLTVSGAYNGGSFSVGTRVTLP